MCSVGTAGALVRALWALTKGRAAHLSDHHDVNKRPRVSAISHTHLGPLGMGLWGEHGAVALAERRPGATLLPVPLSRALRLHLQDGPWHGPVVC
eukprot:15485525-Alexandrium_andersonii.AAC.1